ncbi:hypothetical protein BDY19DRAFT_900417 [Irpex rosettiformis]|uniref:Uncharacterized protein n=1 Tax=Irpex rosettiformis TaxID=378272 RepID=A0ACB8TMX4_9APHY|nr:hypothetical protein BDY19DRAFT_900417 [Irpex rosettiformis]
MTSKSTIEEPQDNLRDIFSTQIVTNYLIYDLIFSAASPGSILRFSRTCHAAHLATRDYFARTFKINKHLSRFFDDPLAFRSLQAKTSTLISGSSALQFFDRTHYEESDLDLYVSAKHHREVGRWMLAQGYKFTPNSIQDPDFEISAGEDNMNVDVFGYVLQDDRMKGVAAVFTFHKQSPTIPGKRLQVQVIVANTCPMEVILWFHSTVVINVISWDRAYSLYPRATFEHRKSVLLRQRHHNFDDVIQKYTNRGFGFVFTLDHDDLKSDPAFASSPRWIGDGHSWVIDLPTEGVTLPQPLSPLSKSLTRDPCYLSTWRLARAARPTEHVVMDLTVVFSDELLYYNYVLWDDKDEQIQRVLRDAAFEWFDKGGRPENPSASSIG